MNEKYKNQNKLHKKKIILILILILTLILAFVTTILFSIKNKNKEKEEAILSGQFNSIEDILEYYGCKLKKINYNENDEFQIDMEVIFKYDLYENDKSNEKFYNDIINEIAKFSNFVNFKMIDKSRNDNFIEIKVICSNGKIETIIINDIEDYFIYMDSKIGLKQYKEIPITNISIDSPELINCIQNDWNSASEFGSREAIFQDYYIYLDENIKTRKIDGKIYNIIFTKNYVNSVINGFTVGTESDIIKSRMGKPAFESDDKSIIGYKCNDIYVFFEKDQISIYRNSTEEGYDEFFKLTDKFLSEEYSLLEFMNELTYLWPDYEEYTYDSETVFLSYPNKGIDIKINYENEDGIILYNNIGINQETISKYSENTEFVVKLSVDNVFNAEQRRTKKENEIEENCNNYKEEFEKEDERNRGRLYNYYMKMDENNKIRCAYFISQDSQYPNCELSENIDTYVWLNDFCFIYSIENKGIYYYDLKNQIRGVILTGNDNKFKIKSYKDGILQYDTNSVEIQY